MDILSEDKKESKHHIIDDDDDGHENDIGSDNNLIVWKSKELTNRWCYIIKIKPFDYDNRYYNK